MYVPDAPHAAEIVTLLRKRRKTLAAAESLTCGMFSSHIGDIAGASYVFMGGAVTYSPQLKTLLCGVSPEVISDAGVVSPGVAVAMADGIRRRTESDIAVSFTGVAGPGPSEGKPAGTVFIAVATKKNTFLVGNLYSWLASRPLVISGELTPGSDVDEETLGGLAKQWRRLVREHTYSIDACRLALESSLSDRTSVREASVRAGLTAVRTMLEQPQW